VKILFIEHSGFGNMITATPAIRAFATIANEPVHVCCWNRSMRAIQNMPGVIVTTKHPVEYLYENGNIFDVVAISPVGAILHPDIAKYTKKIISNQVQAPWTMHESEYKMQLVRRIGYIGDTPLPECHLSDEATNTAIGFVANAKYACVNASYLKEDHWHLKHWGNNNYTELANLIHEKLGIITIFVGAECDSSDAENIIKSTKMPTMCRNMCGIHADIQVTGAIIKNSAFLAGNDSGLAHMSAALGVKTITIFTFTNIIKNSPIGNKSKIVYNQCERRLLCQHGQWKTCTDNGCHSIQVDTVFDTILSVY